MQRQVEQQGRVDYSLLSERQPAKGERDLAVLVDHKSATTLGLVDKATKPPPQVTRRRDSVIAAIKSLAKGSSDTAVYGALLQLLANMLLWSRPIGILTDGGLYVFLRLRDDAAFAGGLQRRVTWRLQYYVHEIGNTETGDPAAVMLITAAIAHSDRATVNFAL